MFRSVLKDNFDKMELTLRSETSESTTSWYNKVSPVNVLIGMLNNNNAQKSTYKVLIKLRSVWNGITAELQPF